MTVLQTLRPVMGILLGASVMLTISMGLRQSLGLFMQPLTRDIVITVADFTLAIAVQNLAWGFLQPVAGALAVRTGFRPLMVAGAAFYVAGLVVLYSATGFVAVLIGAGFLIGTSLACTAAGIALAVASHAVPASVRSVVLGAVTAAGSLGALLSAPLGQMLAVDFGWRIGILGFAVLALGMLPAAWVAGRVDRIPLPATPGETTAEVSVRAALGKSLTPRPVPGDGHRLLRVRLAAHLHRDALAVVSRDLRHGPDAECAGARRHRCVQRIRQLLLRLGRRAMVEAGAARRRSTSRARSCSAGTSSCRRRPASTLVFAAAMGFLWLGVGPLVAGSVAEMFGLRWQAMIQGLAFMSHQLGSFVGAFGGGVLFDALGSYDLAWRLAVAMGLTAGIIQVAFALWRRPPPRVAPSPA